MLQMKKPCDKTKMTDEMFATLLNTTDEVFKKNNSLAVFIKNNPIAKFSRILRSRLENMKK